MSFLRFRLAWFARWLAFADREAPLATQKLFLIANHLCRDILAHKSGQMTVTLFQGPHPHQPRCSSEQPGAKDAD